MAKLKVKWHPDLEQDLDSITDERFFMYDEAFTEMIIEKYGSFEQFKKSDDFKKLYSFNLEDYFANLRNNDKHHLGLGDIRLTLAQQEEICELVRIKYNDPEPSCEISACEKCFQMTNHLDGICQKCKKNSE